MGFLSVVPCYVPCGDSPLVRSVGVWVRGGCTVFYAGFGRGYFRGLETIRNARKKVPNFAKIGFSKLAPAYGCSGVTWIATGSAASMVLHMCLNRL